MQQTLVLILLMLCVGCGNGRQTHKIADVKKAESITLNKASSQGDVHFLTVVGEGTIDGSAELIMFENGKPYKTEALSGKVDFTWQGDCYTDSVKVEYKPTSVTKGNLNLLYQFKDM